MKGESMGKINILDCTLRDGGYVNDWAFGKDAINGILHKLLLANVECVEVGFLRNVAYDENRSLFPDKASLDSVLKNKSNSLKYFVMYDVSNPIDIDTFPKNNGKGIDGIRVIFKKDKMNDGIAAVKKFMELGYIVAANFVSTNFYTDEEFIAGIKKFSEYKPHMMTIVDTFGSIKNEEFLHYVKLADEHLSKDTILAYHAHNNLQQAYQNAISFVNLKLDRDILIDASVFGMGRGAGNLNLELFAEYLNANFGKDYHIVPMLEIMDEYLQDTYKKKFWGYSLPLYISGTLNVHPNYAIYLAEKNTLTEKSLYEILKNIKEEDKQNYKKEVAENYYIEYMNVFKDDAADIEKLASEFKGKDVLVLAPGKSINDYKDKINAELSKDNTIGISLNFYNNDFNTEYVFSSNMRRYSKLDYKIGKEINAKVILTSNMREAQNKDYVINFFSIALESKDIIDNAALMVFKLLIKLGINSVKVAGMDGYDVHNPYVYSDESTQFDFSNVAKERNELIKNELDKIKKSLKIEFITRSIYEG